MVDVHLGSFSYANKEKVVAPHTQFEAWDVPGVRTHSLASNALD